ncbi:MAG TPA: efflux RND transporter periplasmic adaptor subunit [Desulfomonilaceae bacterium]|nr:efflux RND transporter periplasmic adaptor subunit [Desulfomonilaceae bacterium]
MNPKDLKDFLFAGRGKAIHDFLHTSRGKAILIVVLVIVAFALGHYWPAGEGPKPASVQQTVPEADGHDHASDKAATEAKKPIQWWTCAMHPQIKLPHPGKCPICFMDLIPLETGKEAQSDLSVAQYSMSEAAKKLAEVETSEVKREQAKVIVRMVGMVVEAEPRVAALVSRVDGRLDEIYIKFTGEYVSKGQPMVKIWSPTLIKSQVELFETIRSEEKDESVIKGAEEKLIQYGLTQEQVEQIKKSKKPDLYITLRAPINGIVTKKIANLGQFVKEGQEMYMINDLSRVWVKMDAYETDMPWVRYGQDVVFTTPAVPGQKFLGKVLFIDPMLDTKTRTVKVRVDAENTDLKLRPGMFVTAELEAEVDAEGRVIKREWAGKYICPVHPSENPSSEPGTCPDSKMPLKPASAYGYADTKDPTLPLVIPASAPLITGKRAIVYVEVPNTKEPTYELREVVLGPRAGDKYVVYSGLTAGEKVVSKGNFKIDSAMQIIGKPSMMRPSETKQVKETPPKAEEEVIEKVGAPVEFLRELTPAVKNYLSLKNALVDENSEEAGKSAEELESTLRGVKSEILEAKAKDAWGKLSEKLLKDLKRISENKDVQIQREAFDPVSEWFARMLMSFRHAMSGPLFLYHCPMAYGQKGAYWIEDSKEIRNPYFGHKPFNGQDMLKCGVLEETIPPEAAPGKAPTEAAGSEGISTQKKPEQGIGLKQGESTKGPESKPDQKDSGHGQDSHGHGSQSHREGEVK